MDKLIAILFSVIVLYSCSEDASHVLPRYTGAPGEIICIIGDSDYEGRPGDIIHQYLGGTHPMLPQAEPLFDLVQMNRSQVNHITQQHRNLLFVHLSAQMEGQPRVEAQKSKWASEQLVVNIYASSTEEFDSLMQENGSSIAAKFSEYERNRLQSYYASKSSGAVSEKLHDRGMAITVPSDCSVAKNTSDFFWIKRQRVKNVGGTNHDILQGVFIYHYPYTSDSAFTLSQLLSVRDSVLKEHVPGPLENSYMTTEYLLPPVGQAVAHDEGYAVEIRGLWKTKGAVMGGPFVSLTVLDEANQRIVTAEGFVFAPKFNKREYIREIEAMIYSLRFEDPSAGAE